jgi:hypothetical protein
VRVKCIWRLILHLRLVRKRKRAHILRRRRGALHEGLRETLGAWSLHGEFIHGALASLSCQEHFYGGGAHLERRAHLISSNAHQERRSC